VEHVRREVYLGPFFTATAFERAFAQFRGLYNVRPLHVSCAPDVLERYCAVFERSIDAHARSASIRYAGIPLAAAVMPPGTIAFAGEVEEARMGAW